MRETAAYTELPDYRKDATGSARICVDQHGYAR